MEGGSLPSALAASAGSLLGHRANAVYNALSADHIPLTLAELNEAGTFSEIGKLAVWSSARVAAACPAVDYCAVAVDDGCRDCPGWSINTGICKTTLRNWRSAPAVASKLTTQGKYVYRHQICKIGEISKIGKNM